MNRITTLGVLLASALLATACAAPPADTPVAETPSTPATESAPTTGDPAPKPPPEPPAKAKYVWLDTELTDAVSGKEFALSDFKGRPVLLHPFAVW